MRTNCPSDPLLANLTREIFENQKKCNNLIDQVICLVFQNIIITI